MSETLVCKLGSLKEGEIQKCELDGGRLLALYIVNGQVHATDDRCTHGNASLSDLGSLDGFVVECGMHFGSFDLRTGQVVSPPCTKPLRVYPVNVRGDEVWVDLSVR